MGPAGFADEQLRRLRDALLGTSAGFAKIQEANKKTFAQNFDFELPNPFAWNYPWSWSAYVLLGLLGLSLCILTTRVKSLDRLR